MKRFTCVIVSLVFLLTSCSLSVSDKTNMAKEEYDRIKAIKNYGYDLAFCERYGANSKKHFLVDFDRGVQTSFLVRYRNSTGEYTKTTSVKTEAISGSKGEGWQTNIKGLDTHVYYKYEFVKNEPVIHHYDYQHKPIETFVIIDTGTALKYMVNGLPANPRNAMKCLNP